ncbi:MAG: hypothetical protein ACYCOZ_11615, partial [Metallibacterium scheffleri]
MHDPRSVAAARTQRFHCGNPTEPCPPPMIQHFTLRLAQSRMLAASVRHLAFARTDGQPFAFTPGQFL